MKTSVVKSKAKKKKKSLLSSLLGNIEKTQADIDKANPIKKESRKDKEAKEKAEASAARFKREVENKLGAMVAEGSQILEFPPMDSESRYIIHEIATDLGLVTSTELDEASDSSYVVVRAQSKVDADEASIALATEKAIKVAEERARIAAETKKRKRERVTDADIPVVGEETVDVGVVKRDRRTILEIQQDLKNKRK